MWFPLKKGDVPLRQWIHAMVTFDEANQATLYLNGEPRAAIDGKRPATVGPVWP